MMREISNKDLQSHLLRDTAYKTISLTNGYHTYFKYKMVDVLDVTRDKTDHSNDMFYLIHANEILKADDPNVVVVPNVKTFADCYRACKNSDELNCRTLSYCSGDKTNECLVTNMVPSAAPIDEFENNPKCGIFTENPVLHYTVNRNRRFKSQSSLSEELWLYQCASKCGSDNHCHSFQICGSTCTLNEAYTDTATEYSDTCDIYIPKVANEYFATGHKLVTEVFHTEYNINHDQCAALCFSRIGGTEPCQSFNFCPKGRSTSTCSLSKFSVKDSKTKTHEEKSCLNYGLIDPFRHEYSSPVINVKKGTSGSAAFVIILFFLATGFLFGIGIPIAYSKIKTLTIRSGQSSNDNYAWTRQMDEQPLN
ncbi:uncharacterized protein LOC128392426 [Panonychus citri]|uniref:uncharacterized protein LOC128392426 n=1 Tax=Panonychus citri TaxID=50023 RepID=UPI002307C2CB|nr:uncharacterized protein LOC128392426 [Panonychus citri]